MELIIGILGLLAIAAVGFASMNAKQKAADDPSNKDVVYLEQLFEVANLDVDSKYLVIIYRQSGNIQQKDKIYSSANDAIKAAITTFKRAKIPFVSITENSTDKLSFSRPWHSHKGSSEGKKVGSVLIMRMND
ncbi:hypothetical protein [Pantoea agglomerans]|uniref:hypothetical protein n=1 Tax=Enterobacter agglomerans TaxID=549 RepID=UPI001559F114|nr:hypothetical protein [Pantoea agglomerans]NQS80537.1 hypothetical protein [Pantoea agglomerans]